jgi:hypothetical protein
MVWHGVPAMMGKGFSFFLLFFSYLYNPESQLGGGGLSTAGNTKTGSVACAAAGPIRTVSPLPFPMASTVA